jgi:hypothetical protein
MNWSEMCVWLNLPRNCCLTRKLLKICKCLPKFSQSVSWQGLGQAWERDCRMLCSCACERLCQSGQTLSQEIVVLKSFISCSRSGVVVLQLLLSCQPLGFQGRRQLFQHVASPQP